MSDLTGRVALVTGGSRGIGRAIVEELARHGCRVAVIATSDESAEVGSAAAAELGAEARPYAADVSDPARADEIVADLLAAWGSIDILVNNAGITRDGLLVRLSADDISRVVDTNLKGALYYAKSVARPMGKARRGAIVNVSSIVGFTGNIGQSNYAAAKAGLFGLTRSLAAELGPRGIRVNAISPGFIETDMTSGLPEEFRQASLKKIPVGRLGQPADIARATRFLVSDEAAYVTGVNLTVDGGLSLGL